MRAVLAMALALAACDPGTVLPEDAGARPDAGREMDAAVAELDGGPRMDGGVADDGGRDAGLPPSGDAGWGPCAVGGVPGDCLPIAACTGDRAPTPGFCPGPADIQCCTSTADAGPRPDGGPVPDAGMCDPSAMPTPNEGLVEEAGDPGCPPAMVDLGAFCIDRFEASLELLDASGAVVSSWSPYHEPGDRRVRAVSLRDAVPQGYITGRHAATACAEAGKRLCTNEEWLSACRGAANRTYPYGNTRMDGVCNDARAVHPAVERFGTSADWIWSRLGDACINQIPDSLARTGAHPGCVTPEGVLDLMGNLHEWTSDPSGTFRGGFYADTYRNGEGCLYRTTAHSMGHWDYSTGFRCCADP